MTLDRSDRVRLSIGAALIALLAAGGGYWLAQSQGTATPPAPQDRRVLYWYDPMAPGQHFDKPGKSPFMDMQLVPRYAESGPAAGGTAPIATGGVSVDARAAQSLGIRTVAAERTSLASPLSVTGTIAFNERNVAIVQSRSAGFVQRVYGRAPGDVVGARAAIADLLIPAWGGAQAEFLAVKGTGDVALTAAARQRLMLLGMSSALIASIERSGRPQTVITIVTPVGGAIQSLDVRAGMTVAAAQTLAQVNGLGTVWLNAAVPEADAGRIRLGQPVRATLSAFPTEIFTGRVTAVLPAAQADSRTLTVRVELANRTGRLRPGMFARVDLGDAAGDVLTVPSEAVIRTGARVLVMLAKTGGGYQPTEVTVGREGGGRTEITAGLSAGQKVVASGQFLLDSEASLSGIDVTPLGKAATPLAGAPMTPAEMRK
ncbi:MAG: efflux RND transporter periplasmic adaptor subunit [Sandarakinorhabdus sp.]|nr:efflux RND transporter periplasmic adaptor subunit [Sandarakinorhabdus sp.]